MEILRLLSEIRTPILDIIAMIVTYLGSGIFFLALVCLLFWCVDKRFAYRLTHISVVSSVFIQGLKIVLKVPRPWIMDKDFEPVKGAKATADGYSCPSGHSGQATALATTISAETNSIVLKIICYVLMLMVIFSRMYLGVHTPLDVGIGFGISLVVSVVINYYTKNYELSDSLINKFNFFMAIVTLATLGYTFYLWLTGFDAKLTDLSSCAGVCGLALGIIIGRCIETKYINFDEKAATLPMQVIKYAVGIVILALFHVGAKVIVGAFFPEFIPAYFIYHFMDAMIAVCLYPIVIKKYFTNPYILK